jgi:hypothetical protein
MAKAPDQPASGTPFVRDVVSDPNNVPDLMLLYGYLGASSVAEHERLYLSADLSNYVEIPKSAILHRAAATAEQDPHGGVTLWVKKDAKLIAKMAAGALAHFFTGRIQADAPVARGPQPMPAIPDQSVFDPNCFEQVVGNSRFIRSCWDPNCFEQVVGNSRFIRSCVDPNCFRPPAIAGQSAFVMSCWDPNCFEQVVGNSRFIRSCVDPNCFRPQM